MTEYQRRELEAKLEAGTITKKELRRLKASQKSGGRSSEGYGAKKRRKFE